MVTCQYDSDHSHLPQIVFLPFAPAHISLYQTLHFWQDIQTPSSQIQYYNSLRSNSHTIHPFLTICNYVSLLCYWTYELDLDHWFFCVEKGIHTSHFLHICSEVKCVRECVIKMEFILSTRNNHYQTVSRDGSNYHTDQLCGNVGKRGKRNFDSNLTLLTQIKIQTLDSFITGQVAKEYSPSHKKQVAVLQYMQLSRWKQT
jgi:hypothetical protein